MLQRLSRNVFPRLARRPIVALVLLASLHLVTITISPTIWQDEVQIVDLGRQFLAPDPAWSMDWTAEQRPLAILSYLGPAAQELAYRSLAPSNLGPRLSALLGAAVASGLIFFWLRARALAPGPSLVLAAAFLLDPMFVQGYRGARVDCWAIAFVVAAGLAVRRARLREAAGEAVAAWWAVAGALPVVAFFVWPAAIFLYPLLLTEVLPVRAGEGPPSRSGGPRMLAAAAGALIALTVCLFPMRRDIASVLVETVAAESLGYDAGTLWTYLPDAVRELLWSFQLSPFLPFAAVVATVVTPRNRIVASAAAASAVLMLLTHMYVHRAVYLLPYLIAVVGESWRVAAEPSARRRHVRAAALILIWAAGVSLVARPALALTVRAARNPLLLEEAAAALPELRHERVYLGPWELYYAGRRFGWKMVHPFNDIGADAYRSIFDGLDYAFVSEDEHAFFEAMGWRRLRAVTLPPTGAIVPGRGAGAPRRYVVFARQ